VSVMMLSCQNSLGVGMPEPPIINAFNGSAGSSAHADGAAVNAISVSEAPTSSAPNSR
jgi:hypothetical protein